MDEEKFKKQVKVIYHRLLLVFSLITLVIVGATLYILTYDNHNTDKITNINTLNIDENINTVNKIENGIHVRTGLVDGEGVMQVVNNCTSCHSSKLIIQNRMSEEMWLGTIKWMQETQNLHDLGENENIIVKYLSTYYAPQKKGRREPLANIEWYELHK